MYTSEDLAPTWQESIAHLAGFLTALEATAGETRLACDVAFAKWRQAAGILRAEDRTLYLIGNGASASMASHFAADLSKNAHIRAQVFTDLSQVTAIGNDMAFDQIYAVPLSRYARPGDMLVAISSSGASPNILAGVEAARARGVSVVTLSGFKPNNPLRARGDINFHVSATSYGIVETCHAALLHFWLDGMVQEAARVR